MISMVLLSCALALPVQDMGQCCSWRSPASLAASGVQTAGEADQAVQRYADSVESLVRNNIQKAKIDMANEVIDAGRFDMQTTMGERKMALESLLQVPDLPLSLLPILYGRERYHAYACL